MKFETAVLKAAAALLFKIGALHLLTVRGRLMTGNFIASRKAAWKEDTTAPGWLVAVLKVALGAFGPIICSVERWAGAATNASENEPYFLAVAIAYSVSGIALPTWATTAVQVYVGARYAHCFVYLLGDYIPQPTRATCYLVGQSAAFALAGAALAA